MPPPIATMNPMTPTASDNRNAPIATTANTSAPASLITMRIKPTLVKQADARFHWLFDGRGFNGITKSQPSWID